MILTLALIILSAAILIAFIRLLMGPSGFDRLLAADTLTIITTGLIVLLAYYFSRPVYMDVSLVYALLGFVGVVTVARFLAGGLK
jgi:multicomponent Na+:H+ antiporter subunit F